MGVQKKLANFYKLIINDASDQQQKFFFDTQTELKENFCELIRNSLNTAFNKINFTKNNLEREKNQNIMAMLSNTKKNLLLKREELKHNLFNELEDKLISFAISDKYLDYILREIKNFDQSNILRLEFNMRDKNLIQELQTKLTDIEFIFTQENFIGGFKIYLRHTNALVDKTFRSKLELAKNNFNELELPEL